MSGLRQKKKQETSRKIMDCASKMFRENGYEAARIEDIAAEASLSVATFYNYFNSKADILLATVVAETEMVIEAIDACIEKSDQSLEAAFDEIAKCYFEISFQYTSRETWCTAVARTLLNPSAEFSRRYLEIDRQLAAQLCRFLKTRQEQGQIARDVDTDVVGQLLFNNVNMNFLEFMRRSDMGSEDVRAAVNRQSAPVFRCIATKTAC